MNLVFNLVTQQDNKVNTAIARDTNPNSASMKVISMMTMIFLPTTAASGFFSMCFHQF
jgi:Mg2+ and Co2+ transporter CorA